MKKIIIVLFAALLIACGGTMTAKVKIVYVTMHRTGCTVGYVFATSPDERTDGNNLRDTNTSKIEWCSQLKNNIGAIYTITAEGYTLTSLQREER